MVGMLPLPCEAQIAVGVPGIEGSHRSSVAFIEVQPA